MSVGEISEVCLAVFTGLTVAGGSITYLFKIAQVFDGVTSLAKRVDEQGVNLSKQADALEALSHSLQDGHARLSLEIAEVRGHLGLVRAPVGPVVPRIRRTRKARR